MKVTTMPTCNLNLIYFPSKVVFIDDSEKFLSAMDRHFKNPQYRYYTDPQQALADLQQVADTSIAELLQNNKPEDSEDELGSLSLMVPSLYQKKTASEHHNIISVVVVDQAMPAMDGLTLCEAIKDKAFKKIMLTASSDFQMATKAFNSGKIDKFIVKDSPTMLQELQSAIAELQNRYFYEYSLPLSKLIKEVEGSTVANGEYLKLWQKIYTESKAVEYYLLDTRGSYVFVDAAGIQTWLIIRHEDDMESYYNIAKDNGADEQLLKKLKSKHYLPIFFTENDYQLPINQWLDNLYKFRKLSLDNRAYYIVIHT
jgi:CheY-like chemotaxis protein